MKFGIHTITFILLIVGGLNWLLYALGWGIGGWISASWWSTLTMIIYILVGLSAIYELATHSTRCKACDKGSMPSSSGSAPRAM